MGEKTKIFLKIHCSFILLCFLLCPANSKQAPVAEAINIDANAKGNLSAKTFTFRELASATKNFRQECVLGEGGFGRVFKGTLQSSGQVM